MSGSYLPELLCNKQVKPCEFFTEQFSTKDLYIFTPIVFTIKS